MEKNDKNEEINDLSFFEKEFIKIYYNNLAYDGIIHELPKENLKENIFKDCIREIQNLYYMFHIKENNCTTISMDDSESLSKIYDSVVETFIDNGQLEIVRFLIEEREKNFNSLVKTLQSEIRCYYGRYHAQSYEENYFLLFLIVNRIARDITYDIKRRDNGLIGTFKYPDELVEASPDFEKILLSNYENYSDFDSLYDDAIEFIKERRKYMQLPLPESSKGKWIHFGSESFTLKELLINYFQLKTIYRYSWKHDYAIMHLLFGDYYVFVDHLGIPKIYVIIENGEIEEINDKDKSKIKKLNRIKIDDEYRDELDSFLDYFNNWSANVKIDFENENQRKLTYKFIK